MLSLKVVSKVGKPGEHRRIGTYYHLGSIEPGVTKTAHQVKHRSRVIIATGPSREDPKHAVERVLDMDIRLPVTIGHFRLEEVDQTKTPVRSFQGGHWYIGIDMRMAKEVLRVEAVPSKDTPIPPVGVESLTGKLLPSSFHYPILQVQGDTQWVANYIGPTRIDTPQQLHRLLKSNPTDFEALLIKGDDVIPGRIRLYEYVSSDSPAEWAVDDGKLLYHQHRARLVINHLTEQKGKYHLSGFISYRGVDLKVNRILSGMSTRDYRLGYNRQAKISALVSPNGLYYSFDHLPSLIVAAGLLVEV